MEPPLVSFELKEKYLLVVGHGKRDSFASMIKSTESIFVKVMETNSRRVLLDYRGLQFSVQLNEAFNIVKRYEVTRPQVKNISIAAVFQGQGLEFGRYLQEVASQRGFDMEIFQDIKLAEKWLLEKSGL